MSPKSKDPKNKYKVIFKWKAPMRVYRKHHNQDYLMVAFITLPLLTFFTIVGQYMLVAATIALIFLTFILWSIKPTIVQHKITTLGVYSIDRLYKWENLESYWVSKIQNLYVLNIETNNLQFLGNLVLLLGKKEDAKKVHNILQDWLEYKVIDKQNFIQEKLDGIYIPLKDEPAKDKIELDFGHKSSESE
jgi:hypothetical protein